jgi:hypothetical protein
VAGVAYGGLVWYPERAAADLMRPSSEEFAASVDVYRSTMASFPPGATDPQALIDASAAFVTAVGPAREELTRASARLDQRESADLPVISGRQPLRQARVTRDRMLDFYTSTLETLASVEGVAGYLTLVGPVLPVLDNLEQALGTPGQDEVDGAVASATPIADQILADLQAITPPEEMGGVHATLVAIAERIRLDLDEIARAGQEGTEQVVRALVQDVRAEIVAFREAVGAAPRDAGRAGLDDRKARVDELIAQVAAELDALRDRYGITGLTIPSVEPTPDTGV